MSPLLFLILVPLVYASAAIATQIVLRHTTNRRLRRLGAADDRQVEFKSANDGSSPTGKSNESPAGKSNKWSSSVLKESSDRRVAEAKSPPRAAVVGALPTAGLGDEAKAVFLQIMIAERLSGTAVPPGGKTTARFASQFESGHSSETIGRFDQAIADAATIDRRAFHSSELIG